MSRIWRVQLDVPYQFAVEPGFAKAQYCADFAPSERDCSDIWRDPSTGIVMLRPKALDGDYANDAIPLSQFNKSTAWAEVKRRTAFKPLVTAMLLNGMSNVRSYQSLQIQLTVQAALIAISSSLPQVDALEWALESTTTLADDEGWVLSYFFSNDEVSRYANVAYLQWDNIGIHLSGDGTARVYWYADRNDLNNPAKVWLLHSIALLAPQEIFNAQGFLMFVPIAPLGLLIYHQSVPLRSVAGVAGRQSATARTVFVPFPAESYATNQYRIFRQSAIRVGLNPNIGNTLAFYRLRFRTSGTFVDAPFDPHYPPSTLPTASALLYPNGRGSATASVIKKDSTNAWAVGDHHARIKVDLSTTDARYSPLLGGWHARWQPVFATRNTTAVTVPMTDADAGDRLVALEFSQDVRRRWEGKAKMLLRSAAAKNIALRGDSTFTVEYSDNGGTTWDLLFGGLAKDWSIDYVGALGADWLEAECQLVDLWERFAETHLAFESANDGLSIADAINNVLQASGFPAATPPANLPAVSLPLPPAGSGWQFAPSAGTNGAEMIAHYLAFLRKQWEEWLLVFDWQSGTWQYVQRVRPYPPEAWINWWLVPLDDYDEQQTDFRWGYSSLHVEPEPPEANVILVAAVADESPGSPIRILSPPARNLASLTNPSDPDYLGRIKMAIYEVEGAITEDESAKMCRRLYDALAHRRVRARLTTMRTNRYWNVDEYCEVRDENEAAIFRGWIKRLTTIIDEDGGKQILELDSQWESEL